MYQDPPRSQSPRDRSKQKICKEHEILPSLVQPFVPFILPVHPTPSQAVLRSGRGGPSSGWVPGRGAAHAPPLALLSAGGVMGRNTLSLLPLPLRSLAQGYGALKEVKEKLVRFFAGTAQKTRLDVAYRHPQHLFDSTVAFPTSLPRPRFAELRMEVGGGGRDGPMAHLHGCATGKPSPTQKLRKILKRL